MKSFENLKIIAAGGGAPNKSSAPALTEAVEMSGARKPNILIIPTAKATAETHNTSVRTASELYNGRLGLDIAVLHDFGVDPTEDQIAHEVGSADVVYISGGDTDKMMEVWNRSGVAQALGDRALTGGVVLSGISAGAIAPFSWGHSDSLSYRPEHTDDWDYIAVSGMGLVPAAVTPHHNKHHERLGSRAQSFDRMFGQEAKVRQTNFGFGIDDFAALKIQDGIVQPYYTKPDHKVTLLMHEQQGEVSSQIMASEDIVKLAEL